METLKMNKLMKCKFFSVLACVLLSLNSLGAEETTLEEIIDKGQKLLFLGEYEEALKVLRTALKKAPQSSSALLYLARAYAYNDELVKAEKPFLSIL